MPLLTAQNSGPHEIARAAAKTGPEVFSAAPLIFHQGSAGSRLPPDMKFRIAHTLPSIARRVVGADRQISKPCIVPAVLFSRQGTPQLRSLLHSISP